MTVCSVIHRWPLDTCYRCATVKLHANNRQPTPMQNITPIRLPIVKYENKHWFFDARLRQIRNIENPHDYQDLNVFEVEYFIQLTEHLK